MFVPQENRRDGEVVNPTIQVIDNIEKLLREKGWVNRNPVLDGQGKYCIGSALANAYATAIETASYDNYYNIYHIMLEAANIQTGKRWEDIPTYNDAPGRIIEEVWDVLRIAREIAK